MSVDVSEFRTGFDAVGSEVSTDGTGEETVEAGVGNDTDSKGGTVSDIVTGTCGEKYGIDSKNVTSTDTKYFLVERL